MLLDRESFALTNRPVIQPCTWWFNHVVSFQLPDLQFALNHHGDPDVAIFDFTSMFASNNSAYVQEKFGKQLLCALVGDGLIEVWHTYRKLIQVDWDSIEHW